jgi:hypothetical protein
MKLMKDTIRGLNIAKLQKVQKYTRFVSRSTCSTTIRKIDKHNKVLHMYCPVKDEVSRKILDLSKIPDMGPIPTISFLFINYEKEM